MPRILTVAVIAVLTAFAVGFARTAPQRTADNLASVAPRLIPPGSTVIVAQEMNATFGIVAYRTPSATGAFAVRWQGRWVKERTPDPRFLELQPRRGRVVKREPLLISAHALTSGVIVRAGLWVNGRQVISPFSTGNEQRLVFQYLLNPRRGWNTVAVFCATKAGAAAAAWSFASR